MPSLASLALGLAVFAGSTTALNLAPRADGQAPRVVQHAIRRRHVADPLQHDRNRLRRRAGTVSANLQNQETLYLMEVTIGTPPQDLSLHIDTGSSDLWVNVPTSGLCSSDENACATGVYSANASSTYQYVDSNFNITYVDGTGATGDYALDTVKFSGVTLSDQRFGIGYASTTSEGIIGIGYIYDEDSIQFDNGATYANVPQSLLDDGYINSKAYSLFLNDLESSTGSIIFGGVDTTKYTGQLQTVPIIPQEGGFYAQLVIALTAVGVNGQPGAIASNIAMAALLDSGSSLMYLPSAIASAIYTAVGATYDDTQGVARIDCGAAGSDTTIDLTFSQPTIKLAMKELILPLGSNGGEEICILGISPTSGSTAVLGDTFIRSAYLVYDLFNNEISLAQASYDSSSSNVLEISNSTGVPDAVSVPNAVTTVGTGIGQNVNTPSVTGSFAAPTAAPLANIALLGVAGAALLVL